MKKAKTGITGLDSVLGGGIPRKFIILVEGEPGTGKSNLGLEFLYRGAQNGETGLYISFQETEEEVLRATTFDWEFRKKVEQGEIRVEKFDPYRYEKIGDMLRSAAITNKADRIVLDPITDLDLYIDSRKDQRKNLLQIKEEVQSLNATCLMMGEEEESTGLEEEIADGIIEMSLKQSDERLSRTLIVRKLKAVRIDQEFHRYKLDSKGITVQ